MTYKNPNYPKEYRSRPENKQKTKEYRENHKEIMKVYGKNWRKKNKERVKESKKRYNKENKVKIREKAKKSYLENPERFKKYREKFYLKNKKKYQGWGRKYREGNKDKINEMAKKYYQNNKEKIGKRTKEWCEENKEKVKDTRKNWRENNRNVFNEKGKKYIKERREKDFNFRTRVYLRARVWTALNKYTKTGKIKSACEYGIDYGAIIKHLKPFPENISEYHIDHIKPLCSFNLENPKEIKIAFAPENHQWLTAQENLSKGGKQKL